jgi:C_GCAxxG_C_C family probable redox protein
MMVKIRKAVASDITAIKALLNAVQLHTEGMSEQGAEFLVAEEKGELVGVIGMENRGAGTGLLRSFTVRGDCRQRGIGRQLYERLCILARQCEISSIYLFTLDAQGYFAKLGFVPVVRAQAPQVIKDTQQFRELCPASAVLMSLALAKARDSTSTLLALESDTIAKSLELFDSGFYCAEAVLLAIAKHHGLESPLIPGIATGLCSGMARTSGICGALTGGILGINMIFGRDRQYMSVEQNYRAVQRLVSEFRENCGSTQCSELLGCDLGTPQGQHTFVAGKLHKKCRDYSAVATRIAVALTDEKSQGKS